MFGHEEHDWLAPFESVPDVSTTDYDYVGQRPRATKAASVYKAAKAAKGASVYKGATVYKAAKGATVYKAAKGVKAASVYKGVDYGYSPQFRYAAGYGPTPLPYAPKGIYPPHPAMRGYGGFGDIDVPYTTSHGVSATAHMTQQSQCGDAFGVQQTLTDLGYPVAIDGIIGPETFGALDAFAAAQGIAYTHGSYPSGAMCQAMEDAWTAAHGQPSPTPAPSPAPASPSSGIVDSTKTWWSNLPTASKYLVAGTGAVAAAVLVAALVKAPKTAHGRA